MLFCCFLFVALVVGCIETDCIIFECSVCIACAKVLLQRACCLIAIRAVGDVAKSSMYNSLPHKDRGQLDSTR